MIPNRTPPPEIPRRDLDDLLRKRAARVRRVVEKVLRRGRPKEKDDRDENGFER